MKARHAVLSEKELSREGIGTLGEKTLHRILKHAVEPDAAFHEIKVLGRVADVCKDGHITEIQTSSFERLVPKLKKFLPAYAVTVIYPIAARKTLSWIHPDTGEIEPARTSPKKGKATDVFVELWKLSDVFLTSGVALELVFLEIDEYRYLDGWDTTKKHGASRMERIPRSFLSSEVLHTPEDVKRLFFPDTLSQPFSVKDYKKQMKCSCRVRWIYSAFRLFVRKGIVVPVGKRGRETVFTVV